MNSDNPPPPFRGTDWKLLSKQTAVNLMRNNEEQGLLYGPLGCLGVGEFEFLSSLKIIKEYEDVFYFWYGNESKQEWENLKSGTLKRYFKEKEFRTNNRDIILSAMNKRQVFIQRDYSTTWESIMKIKIGPEEEALAKKLRDFDEFIAKNS